MHDVLRQRILRKLESLPEDQVYQVMDFMEFLESKYAREVTQEASGLQKFAENLEDRLRKRAVNPANLREAFQLIAAADRVLSQVSQAGKDLLAELGPVDETVPGAKPVSDKPGGRLEEGDG
jgi:phosphoglycerate-specific signal transduction histidine kinase